jgi:predicted ester cyclase
MDEFLSPGLITRTPIWGMAYNRVGLKQLVAHLRAAFPDLHCQMDGEVVDGNELAAHWTLRGTHQGIFLGNRPTGRTVTVQGMIFARLVDNQIVENWILLDQMGMLQQLGIVPPPRSLELPAED